MMMMTMMMMMMMMMMMTFLIENDIGFSFAVPVRLKRQNAQSGTVFTQAGMTAEQCGELVMCSERLAEIENMIQAAVLTTDCI